MQWTTPDPTGDEIDGAQIISGYRPRQQKPAYILPPTILLYPITQVGDVATFALSFAILVSNIERYNADVKAYNDDLRASVKAIRDDAEDDKLLRASIEKRTKSDFLKVTDDQLAALWGATFDVVPYNHLQLGRV